MTRRSLLIDSPRLLELKMDGPALCLRAEGKSRQWFPLRRLSMVICVDVPTIGMEALAATASRGIPVSLFSPGGRMIAQLVHPAALPNPLSHWLEVIPCDEPLATAYGDWLDNQLRHTYALIGCLGRDSAQGAERAEAQLRRLAREAKCLGLVTVAREWMDGLTTALLQAEGMRLGLSASSTQLAGILADLRQAGITLTLTWLVVAARHLGVDEVKNIPAFFEKHLANDIGNWAKRALFTLANQLERKAMGQDLPLPGRR